MTSKNTTAREYLRVSQDRSGRKRSNAEQHNDHLRRAADEGWTLGKPYADTLSASRYSKKRRDGFDELIADLRADTFDAGLLLIWESSRGSRKVGEWVELIDLCESRSVLIHVYTHDRTYDPSNPRDRKSLLEDAIDSEYESAKTHKRSKRAAAESAVLGRPHGRVPYGYKRIYDPSTGELVGQVPEESEAEVVRELFRRFLAAHSLRAVARDFEARGIRKHSGKPFRDVDLRDILMRRLYIGERVHAPKDGGPATVSEAGWVGLVDKADFLAAQRILQTPGRSTTKPGRGVHLLSMIATCDVCQGPLSCRNSPYGMRYTCHRSGHVHIDEMRLDEYVISGIIGYLSRKDVFEALRLNSGNGDELDAIRAQIESIRAELDDLAVQVGAGTISATLAARAEPGILKRLEDAESKQKDLAAPGILNRFVGSADEVTARWKAAPMSTRREIARLLLSPQYLGTVAVTRNPKPGSHPSVEDRVVWLREVEGKTVRLPEGH